MEEKAALAWVADTVVTVMAVEWSESEFLGANES